MYLEHFGLQTDPFKLDPSLDFVFVSTGHEEAIAHLIYGIEQGESFVLITGGIGTGKTLALHFLLDQIISSYRTAFVNVTQINFLELLKLIMDDLTIPFDRKGDRADLLASFKSFLLETRKKREKVLVVVDEAQELSLETLEALRLLSNLTQPGDQILQIVIAGQPGLSKMIVAPELEQLNQRIRVRYDLETLSLEEIGPYVDHRLAVAGCSKSPFSKGALKQIFELSGGVPRLVNFHADKALLAAYVDGAHKVNAGHVEDEYEPTVVEETEPIIPVRAAATRAQRVAPASKKAAMSAMADVDLDEIRDSRPTRRKSSGKKKSNRGALAFWIIFPVLLIAGSWYVYSQTDLIQNFLNAPEPTMVNEPAVVASPESQQAEVDSVVVKQEADEVAVAAAEVIEDPPVAVVEPLPSFVLHVGSFLNQGRATRQLAQFQGDGFEAYLTEVQVGEKVWIRLFLGPYKSLDLANTNGLVLKNQGIIDYFQVTNLSTNES